jgi:hypothetical protein
MAKKGNPEEESIDMNDMEDKTPTEAAEVDTKQEDADGSEPDKKEDVKEAAQADDEKPAQKQSSTGKTGPHHSAWNWAMAHKKISIPAAVVLVLAVVAAVPFTRYLFAGMVVRSDFSVVVTDSQTSKPVSSASVTLEGKKVLTDGQGKAKVHANVGSAQLNIDKKYYKAKSASVLVPFKQKQAYTIQLEATGRPVPVTVVNKISGKVVSGVTIAAGDTQAITDTKGEAVLVVPADKAELKATLTGNGYNKADVTLKVTASVDPANKFGVTPVGKLYFLSNASGKLDVMKSDLDGQNRQLVLAGTGKEDKFNTVLLASRDWKYVALLSKRDGGDSAKLFLIETDSDKLTTMDEGNAEFSPYGWSGSRFIYKVTRGNVEQWQPKHEALKSYEAASKNIAVLDQTAAEGDQNNARYEQYGDIFIFDKEVVYAKNWGTNNGTAGAKQATFNSIQADGSQHKAVKTYEATNNYYNSIEMRVGDLNELYIKYPTDNQGHYKVDEYEGGKLTASDWTSDQFYQQQYNTYIVSPSGNKTFWTEYRDGKNIFFIGDNKGQNGKQLTGSSDEFAAYGWFTDDYLLLTKKSSELYILPADNSSDIFKSYKIGDYFKPNYLLRGYGYGYGG